MVEVLFEPLPFYEPTVSVGQDIIGVLVFFCDPSQLILPNAKILGTFFNCKQILFPHRDCKSFYVYHLSILIFFYSVLRRPRPVCAHQCVLRRAQQVSVKIFLLCQWHHSFQVIHLNLFHSFI